MHHLKAGDVGDPVRELQAHLRILCHYAGDPNGKFDDRTIDGLKALQSKLKLVPSGELDKATELALDTNLRLLRGALRCLGFFNNDPGKSDPEPLRRAIIDFQRGQNIPQNGSMDAATRAKTNAASCTG